MSENGSWSIKCLRRSLMMFCGLVLIHTYPVNDSQKYAWAISTRLVSRHQRYTPNHNNYTRYSVAESRKTKLLKYSQCKFKNVQLLMLKLNNVIDRYEEINLKALFPGVPDSVLDKSEKYGDSLSKDRRLKFDCTKFKYRRNLKKWTCELLLKFHSDVQRFIESFELLITYKNSPSLIKRLEILKKLKNDLKTLDVEIEDVVGIKNERLNYFLRPDNWKIHPPKSQTDLMVKEWETTQSSKLFLKDWLRKLRKVSKCLKKKMNFSGKKKGKKENVGIM